VKNGEEKTIDFYIEEDSIIPLGYGKNGNSDFFLECLEVTVAIISNQDTEKKYSKNILN
jgi:hypothetical protein